MVRYWLSLIRRGLRKPLPVIWARAKLELAHEADRITLPLRARALTPDRLLRELEAADFEALWQRLASAPYPAWRPAAGAAEAAEAACPGETARIAAAAERAARHEVTLLGLAAHPLGPTIDWHRDHRSGTRFAPSFYRNIEYTELGKPSDVKIPWEISRLHWLIPAGQAYLLTRDDRHAAAVRGVLEQWIDGNPYAGSVNWTCTMEVALRVLTWSWLFHACHDAPSWRDAKFRRRFLTSLYLHGEFTATHLEKSDINGNHYTADAAGLVFAGLFFSTGRKPRRWAALGWDILRDELPRQVTADGVDFEGSVPYHRLVLELFLLPALYRIRHGLAVDAEYRERLLAMARFTQAYSRDDGSVPLWGDADDARALPFGGQALNDHRYLPALAGLGLGPDALAATPAQTRSEVLWVLGPDAVARSAAAAKTPGTSQAFSAAGYFVMRGGSDHVFIDCGPVGLAGRGGHGHNDCLGFEAVLDGVRLVTDGGAYTYTASIEWRNRFRSTAQHNTPQIAGEEINRLVHTNYLWSLHNDASPELRQWQTGEQRDVLVGAHTGYRRLHPPVTPVRTFMLDKVRHVLMVEDRFEGETAHAVRIPFHFAPGVAVEPDGPGQWRLTADGKVFLLIADGNGWTAQIESDWVSPSYGVKEPATTLVFMAESLRPLRTALMPRTGAPERPGEWLRTQALV